MENVITNITLKGEKFIVAVSGLPFDSIEISPSMPAYSEIKALYSAGSNPSWLQQRRGEIALLEQINDLLINLQLRDTQKQAEYHESKLDELRQRHYELQVRFSELMESLESGKLRFREKLQARKELQAVHEQIVHIQSQIEAEAMASFSR